MSNHVVLRFSTAELYRTYGQMFTEWAFESTFGDGPRSVTIPEPTAWPPLPTVGDELPENGETMHRLTVQPESRIAGPLRLNLNDASGGFAAIFEVTGDPQEVFAAYLDHLAELGPTGPEPTTSTSGEATTTHAHVDQAGGDSFLLTLVERPGRPTWLAIEAGHD